MPSRYCDRCRNRDDEMLEEIAETLLVVSEATEYMARNITAMLQTETHHTYTRETCTAHCCR